MIIGEAERPEFVPALSVRHLSKRFGGALALDDVALEVASGEVHGLLGQNGSGKSTLIKILSGYHAPDAGAEISVYGERIHLPVGPTDPIRLGISFVHQNLGLIPSLSVLENLRMSEFSVGRSFFINWRAEARKADELFQNFGLSVDPLVALAQLSPVERALVAIVRAFENLRFFRDRTGRPGVLVLDEPTPFLPRDGVHRLFALIRAMKEQQASVIFVSHDIDEIVEITDRVTVLRDGKLVGTAESAVTSKASLVELIVGRKVDMFHNTKVDLSDRRTALRVVNASGKIAKDLSFDLREGEVLGVTGLIGSGFDELPGLIFGGEGASAGAIEIDGQQVELRRMTPNASLAAGVAFLPADRLARSGIGGLSAAENLSIPILRRFRTALGINWSEVHRWSHQQNVLYDVRPNHPAQHLQNFSGGNQQKVLLAKWMQTGPKVLLLDEPTQGVDVGARQTIYSAIDRAKRGGLAVLCASSDAEQLAQICDRVLVFNRGRVLAELQGADVNKARIAETCLQSAPAAADSAQRD